MAQHKFIVTPIGRVQWGDVFEKRQFTFEDGSPMGEPQWTLTLVWDVDEMDDAEKALFQTMTSKLKEVVDAKWPDGHPERNWNGLPIKKGDDSDEFTAGKWVGKFKNKKDKPKVVDSLNQDIEPDSGRWYRGCYARCAFEFWAYDKGSNGVNATYYMVQKTGDGETLGTSQPKPSDVFSTIPPADVDEFLK